MAMFVNLLLVLLLIGAAGSGGYLLARAHFTATIANRVLAYQSRLARAQRDTKQANKDCGRLTAEVARLNSDLARARERIHRYEVALFEGYSDPAQSVDTMTEAQLQHSAEAYVQRVQGADEMAQFDEQDLQETLDAHRRGMELMTREIA